MTTIWAVSSAAPGKTCADARLLGGGTKLEYPQGNDKGQAGWDVGLGFDTFVDLAQKIVALKKSKNLAITRLAINLHGAPGRIDADSKGTNYDTAYDFDKLWKVYRQQMQQINGALEGNAMVLIMGCNVAAGDEGKQFLEKLSSQAFPNHPVVGFTTIGITARQYRNGGSCSEPGMRDSPYETPSEYLPEKDKTEREKEAMTLPWASEQSPHAAVALNGKITRRPAGDAATPQTDYSPENYIVGLWLARIGNWEGHFTFRKDHTCSWKSLAPAASGANSDVGTWKVVGGRVEWQFQNDKKNNYNRQRIFRVEPPMQVNMKGVIVGEDTGLFDMAKQ
jgi:hypothetical protein